MARILNDLIDTSPLFNEGIDFVDPQGTKFMASDSFWDQYFRFQKLASAIAERDGRVSVQVVNNSTGESFNFDNVVLKSSGENPRN